MRTETIVAVLLTFVVHAGVLLALAWALDRGKLRSRSAWRELLWRVALFGAALTAGVQAVSNASTPLRFSLPLQSVQDSDSLEATPQGAAAALDRAIGSNAVVAVASEVAAPSTAAERSAAESELSRTAAGSAQKSSMRTTTAWPSWQTLLLAAWLAGTVLALARLGLAWRNLARMLARAEPLRSAAIATDAAALAIQGHTAPPRLSVLDDLASPIAVGSDRIVLPRWAVELLDREQLRAMLAHEVAHLSRRDPWWKLLTTAWCAVLWFLPLARLARRRLDESAELACDAWAARHLGDGRSLAECLAECAERRLGNFESALVPGMAQRESSLLQRIDYLIGDAPMDTTLSRARAAAAAMFALAMASFLLPGFGAAIAQSAPPSPPASPAAPAAPAAPAKPAKLSSSNTHVHISGETNDKGSRREYTSVKTGDGDHQLDVQIKGKIVFNEREDGVESLSEGGSASFSESNKGSEHRIEYRMRDGKLSQRYFVDDDEQPLDDAGRAWVSVLILNVIRDTALGAEARVKRIHAKGGASAVFDEIAHIESGYARRIYLEQLFTLGKLAPAEVTRALQVIEGLDSDYERRNALSALAAVAPFDESQQKLVIGMAQKIDSDYERTELLIGILPRLAAKPELRKAWVGAAEKVSSDYERRRALGALLDAGAVDDAILAEIIAASNSISSDYERRELLVAVIRRVGDSERIAAAYAKAAGGIGSDYEQREALMALLHAPKFGKLGSSGVLDVADRIGSDHECREVLVALAKVMPRDADLVERYRGVARRLSDSDRGAAERALDRDAS